MYGIADKGCVALAIFGIMGQTNFSASFITAFVFSTTISGLTYFFVTFDIFRVMELCYTVENDEILLGYALIQALICALLISYFNKKSNKGAILGIAPVTILSLGILFVKGPGWATGYAYYEPFDEKVWKSSSSKPEKMMRWMVKEDMLKGWDEHRVIDVLGPIDSSSLQTGVIYFSSLNGAILLQITFKNHKVSKEEIQCNIQI